MIGADGEDIEQYYNPTLEPPVIRQILSPEGLVDITREISTGSLLVRFFRPADYTLTSSGFYDVSTLVEFARWVFSEPSQGTVNVTQTLDGITVSSSVTEDPVAGIWSQTLNGKTTARQVIESGTGAAYERQEVTTVSVVPAQGGPAQIVTEDKRIYRAVPMSSVPTAIYSNLLVAEIEDPNGLNRGTYHEYYDEAAPTYKRGLRKSTVYPDGNWEAFDYRAPLGSDNDGGRPWKIFRPWQDQPALPSAATEQNSRVTLYSYGTDYLAGSQFNNVVTGIEERILGVTTAKRTIFHGGEGGVVADYTTEYSDAATLVYSFSANYIEDVTNNGSPWPGRPYFAQFPDGRATNFDYQKGIYDPQTRVFTVNPGGFATRSYVFHGSQFSGEGEDGYPYAGFYLIPLKSTREVRTTDGRGQLVYEATEVYTGGGQYATVTWQAISYNLAGQRERTDYHDGTFEQYGWTGNRLDWETGRTGVRTDYLDYDGEGRLLEKVVEGKTGVVPEQLYTYDYDIESGCGCEVATTTLAAGNVTLTERVQQDSAGRLKERLGQDGGLTQFTYTDPVVTVDANYRVTAITGPRLAEEQHPGGWATVTAYHRDGQIASVTGPAVTDRFYEYAVLPDGQRSTTIREGSVASPRFRRTLENWRGQVVREEAPAFDGTVAATVHTYAATTGLLERTERPATAPLLSRYDTMGNVVRQGFDLDGSGDLEPLSADRYRESSSGYEQRNGQWWSRQSAKRFSEDGSDTQFEETIARSQLTGLSSTAVREQVRRIVDSTGTTDLLTSTSSVIDRTARTVSADTKRPDNSHTLSTTGNGYLTSVYETASGLTTTLAYDEAGRLRESSDTSGHFARTTWHPGLDRITGTETSESGAIFYDSFDAAGQVTARHDALGRPTYFEFDPRGQLVRQWGEAVYPVEWSYDAFGQMTAMTTFRATDGSFDAPVWPPGAAGDTTSWIYPPHSPLLQKKKDAADEEVVYAYDAAGRLASRQWARGVLTSYGYTASGSGDLTSVSYANDPANTPGVTFAYDRLGRQRTGSDAMGTRTLGYSRGQPAGESLASPAMPALDGVSVTAGYDPFARRTAWSAQQGSTTLGSLTYTYWSSTSRLWKVIAGADQFEAVYQPQTGLLQDIVTRPGGTEIMRATRTWERGRLLDRITTVRPGGAVVALSDYTSDALGRREAAAVAGGESWHYGYDSRDQVTGGEKRDAGGSPIAGYTHGYGFDAIGNRTQSSREVLTSTYTPNALNQSTSRTRPAREETLLGTASAGASLTLQTGAAGVGGTVTRQGGYWRGQLDFSGTAAPDGAQFTDFTVEGRLTGAGSGGTDAVAEETGEVFLPATPEVFTHDDDGNLLSDGRWTYTWNAENRLVAMETSLAAQTAGVPKRRLTFAYDAQGRRFRKQVFDWNGSAYDQTSEVFFIYDGWNPVATLDGDGNPLQTYVWGLDLSGTLQGAGGVGGLLRLTDLPSGKTLYPAYDGNGNVMALVNTLGETVALYEYGPFGEPLRASGPAAGLNPFRFSTKYTDAETGLLYYGFRYYKPETGRWLSRDPIGERGGVNLYGFVNNSPVDQIDLVGLLPDNLKCCKIKQVTVNFTRAEQRPNYPVSTDGVWNHPTGRTFTGTVSIECQDKNVWSGNVQTGGMRMRGSTVSGPSVDNPDGDDSATPAGDFTIRTDRPGKGFPISITVSSTGRGDVTMHYASYRGSHGCPTLTNTTEWDELKEIMELNKDTYGINSAPIRIQYSGISPQGNRGNGRNDPPLIPKALPVQPTVPMP